MDKHRNANGTYNGVSLMSELTGMPEGAVKSLIQQVQENQHKLEACQYHEFEQSKQTSPQSSITHQKYVCRNCGGEVSHQQWRWHEIGRNSTTCMTVIPEAATLTNINQLCPLDKDLSQTDFATGWNDCRQYALMHGALPPVIKGVHAAAQGWNACRAAMLAPAER
ncbi:TPA: hypothetical protein ACQVH3_004680 [Serratia marcescens]